MSTQKVKFISGIFLTIFFVSAFLVNYTIALADVRISGFQNLLLGTWTGSGNREASTDLCAYNSDSENYRITARGAGTGNAFILEQNTGPGEVPYLVHFRRIGGAYVQLTTNSSQAFSGAHTTDENCSGVNNATLRITVQAEDLSTAMAGSYSSNITILMEPD